MSSGVSLPNHTGALLILALGSLAIAFLPLSLLHVVYRKKRRRLREEELMQRSKQKLSPPTTGRQELSGGPSEGQQQRLKTQSHRSFIAGWFGLEGRWAGLSQGEHSSRTLSSRSSSASSLYQHCSEVALASTLAIPSIVLELIRSLDGGLLLAALFLILLPQLRTTFETFMNVHVHTAKMASATNFQTLPLTANMTASNLTTVLNKHHAEARHLETETAQSAHLIAPKSVSPVPLVELILCLAFFALHFIEEFAQLCLRYRKYFWACNSSVVYSSSNGTCEFSSLDYRISRTKRFLIDCSRKTSSTSGTASRTSVTASSTTGNCESRSQNLPNQFVVTENSAKDDVNKREQTEPKKIGDTDTDPNTTTKETDEIDQVCENHNLQDSLQLYNQAGQQQPQDFEPDSLLTSDSSSSYLPSYYWPPVQPGHLHQHSSPTTNATREFYHESGPDSLPYGPHACSREANGGASVHPQLQQATHYCCPCQHQHSPPHPFAYHQTTPSENGSACTATSTSSSTPGVFTKIFLPHTTLATSTPALYFCEGILIAIQPTTAMLWLMLAVILVHKLVTGLLVSFELHEKTTGRQRQLPPPTTILFTVLPLVGYLIVLLINGFFVLRQKERRASVVVVTAGGDSTSTPSDTSSIEMAAIRVIFVAVASATLLHLVLLIIQRNLAHFQPQLQFRKPLKAPQSCSAPANTSTNMSPNAVPPAKLHTSNNHINSSISSTRATTLAQVPMCAMTSTNDHISQTITGPPQAVSLDPEIVTNPPRYGVLHHFTMYTGFIIVLMAIAFLNMKSLKV